MTLDQGLAFGIILCVVAMFVIGTLPYDLVALGGLLAGIAVGIVPARHAFEGFSDEVVVIVAAALVVSEAIARSGAVERIMRPILPKLTTTRLQVPVLVGATLLLSMVSKNVGALAILMPIALQLARRTGTSPSSLLMPMSFASLTGGLVTLFGTTPNIIISEVRQTVLGKPFQLFDFAPVGLGIAACGFVFLSFGWRLLPGNRRAASSMEAAFNIEDYTAEVRLSAQSPATGRTVADLERMGEGVVTVAGVIRERFRRFVPAAGWVLRAGDVLLLRGEPGDLERLVARGRLLLAGGGEGAGEATVVEGVVTASSSAIGRTPRELGLDEKYGIGVLAVSRSGQRIGQLLSTVRLRAGDVVVLRSTSKLLPEALGELRILPLAERSIALGRSHRSWVPLTVLAVAMGLVVAHVTSVGVAFFGAAVVLLFLRVLSMEEAYQTVEWHLLILLGALIPLSHAIKTTGGSALIANGLQAVIGHLPPMGALAAVLVLVMAVTPFLHNAPTVLIMGPIAGSLAVKLGMHADPFLMAVALGAGCDFLTPIGHQCNTLVLGPGGYRFSDYPRLGLPMSIMVVVVGVPLIAWVWPLH